MREPPLLGKGAEVRAVGVNRDGIAVDCAEMTEEGRKEVVIAALWRWTRLD
jgi:hypothetical protein